jgi:hypothetical protein
MTTYTLQDTFNNCKISNHRTMEAAVKADLKHRRKVKNSNGRNSYIPTTILIDGKKLDEEDYLYCLSLYEKFFS